MEWVWIFSSTVCVLCHMTSCDFNSNQLCQSIMRNKRFGRVVKTPLPILINGLCLMKGNSLWFINPFTLRSDLSEN